MCAAWGGLIQAADGSRVLTNSGDIPPAWKQKLSLLLGTEDWYERVYRVRSEVGLFGQQEEVVKARAELIGEMFIERLGQHFAGVADEPGVLRNSRGNPLFLLCFAAANERGAPIALRIANALLKGLR